MSNYEYFNNCVNWERSDVDVGLEEVIDNAEEITYEEMINEVSLDDLHEVFPSYVEGLGGLTLKKDWSVRYFKSKLHGKPVVYVQHSAIEYVFKQKQ